MKRCTKCGIEKPTEQFNKHTKARDGLNCHCKDCRKEARKKHKKEHEKEVVEYFEKYYEDHKDKILQDCKDYRENHKKEAKEYNKEYRKEHKNEKNKNEKRRRDSDLNYKLACNLRSRLYQAIKDKQKSGSAVSDLGCSIDEFIIYIESKFQSGMTWDNYGLYGWHLDHVIPLSVFVLSDREQFLKACHYTNLQPLWAEENLIKHAKLPIN